MFKKIGELVAAHRVSQSVSSSVLWMVRPNARRWPFVLLFSVGLVWRVLFHGCDRVLIMTMTMTTTLTVTMTMAVTVWP